MPSCACCQCLAFPGTLPTHITAFCTATTPGALGSAITSLTNELNLLTRFPELTKCDPCKTFFITDLINQILALLNIITNNNNNSEPTLSSLVQSLVNLGCGLLRLLMTSLQELICKPCKKNKCSKKYSHIKVVKCTPDPCKYFPPFPKF